MASSRILHQHSTNDDVLDTLSTRSSGRIRKNTISDAEAKLRKNTLIKPTETLSKSDGRRIGTRSSQKCPSTPLAMDNDSSFMSNINSGFSQFVNPKKRQRSEKKSKSIKRPKISIDADENQPPDGEIEDIQQVQLIYETTDGHTNLARAAVKNAQLVANRNVSNTDYLVTTATNRTYTKSDYNHIIDETQTETLIIPDTLEDVESQHNDSSWQRDIDRLMKRLAEPPATLKSQIQITQSEAEEQILEKTYTAQADKSYPQLHQVTKVPNQSKASFQQQQTQTTTGKSTSNIDTQTDNLLNSSLVHGCCLDVSTCPCVLRYSKLERLFMEKMSRFISIVPTVQTSNQQSIAPTHTRKHRVIPSYSRFRRLRTRRTIQNRVVTPILNNESPTIDEVSDEATAESENQITDNVEVAQEPIESLLPTDVANQVDNVVSTTVIVEQNLESVHELSSIEKIDNTAIIDHTATLSMTSTSNTYSTERHLVLTASSLDENQKSQFRQFIARFGFSTSVAVDSSTTHIVVGENDSLVCPLTGKIIQGIGRHLFIVSHRWLSECLSQGTIIDERPFEIRGDSSLGPDHGGMRRSRLTPSYLLEKYSICLRCSPSDCAPLQTIEQVQELIELCGAKLVRNFSEIKSIDGDRQMILVLGINGFAGADKKRKALLETCQQFNVRCVNIHWLLISIAKYEIQPLDNYDINQI